MNDIRHRLDMAVPVNSQLVFVVQYEQGSSPLFALRTPAGTIPLGLVEVSRLREQIGVALAILGEFPSLRNENN